MKMKKTLSIYLCSLAAMLATPMALEGEQQKASQKRNDPPADPPGKAGLIVQLERREDSVVNKVSNGPAVHLQGAAVVREDKNAFALRFDGEDDRLVTSNVRSLLFGKGDMTVSLWIKPVAGGIVLSEAKSMTISPRRWQYNMISISRNGILKAGVWTRQHRRSFLVEISIGKVTFGRWHHVVYRYGGQHRLLEGFLDGKRSPDRDIVALKHSPKQMYFAFGVGSSQKGGLSKTGRFFKGDMKEIRVYNRFISDKLIAQLAGKPIEAQAKPWKRSQDKYFLRPGDRILFIGNSITHMAAPQLKMLMEDIEKQYPLLAKGEDKVTMIERGSGGETCGRGAKRLRGEIKRYKPTVCVIGYGTCEAGWNSWSNRALFSCIAMCKQAGVAPVVVGPPPIYEWYKHPKVDLKKYNRHIEPIFAKCRLIAELEEIPFVDTMTAFKAVDPEENQDLMLDGIHLKPSTYKIMAEALQKTWNFGKPLVAE